MVVYVIKNVRGNWRSIHSCNLKRGTDANLFSVQNHYRKLKICKSGNKENVLWDYMYFEVWERKQDFRRYCFGIRFTLGYLGNRSWCGHSEWDLMPG